MGVGKGHVQGGHPRWSSGKQVSRGSLRSKVDTGSMHVGLLSLCVIALKSDEPCKAGGHAKVKDSRMEQAAEVITASGDLLRESLRKEEPEGTRQGKKDTWCGRALEQSISGLRFAPLRACAHGRGSI